jgi:hypothetical protein
MDTLKTKKLGVSEYQLTIVKNTNVITHKDTDKREGAL